MNTMDHYINEFLGEIDVMPVKCPKMDPAKIDYAELKSAYKLENEGDIIWLKFTTDGYVGVVAQSNDINFDLPFTLILWCF